MHFALVHGAYHGAWCWERLRAELGRDGHTTSAADLPCEDHDAGAERYADAVISAIPNSMDGLVLVGHSLAGLTIPVVAERTKPKLTVYLCALLPEPGKSFDAQQVDFATEFEPSATAISHPDGSASWPVGGAIELFYHDCDPAAASDAAQHLRRQHWRVTQEITPLREWPANPSAYILCDDDRAVSPAYSRRASRKLLGIDPVEMPGGHSPFLSRPRLLADVLERLSATLPDVSHR